MSAHRDPEKVREYCHAARMRGLRVIIAGAGMSAALPGVAAAHTDLPVIGVPILGKSLGGLDALLSAVQMPPGVPVACVAIDGAKNAGLLAGAHTSPLVIARYTRDEIGAVWSDERRMQGWLEVELAATDAWAAEGRVPAEAAAACRERAVVHGRGGPGARADHQPRRRRLRRRRRGLGRRAGALDPLRAHLLRRARHGARRCSSSRPGRSWSPARPPTATRSSRRRASTPRRSASGAPTASTPSRRPSACGWPASPSRPTATSSRLRRAFEQAAVGKLSGAVGTYASIPPAVEAQRDGARSGCAPRTPRPRSCPATATPSCSGDRARRRRARALRPGGPQPAADRGARGRGAVRVRCAEGLLGDAAQAQPDLRRARSAGSPGSCAATRRRGSRTSPSGTSATSRTREPSG